MQTITKIFNWIKANPTFTLLIVCVILILLLVRQCNRTSYYKNINEQTIGYYTDSLRTERTKYGDIEFAHNILLTKVGDLQKQNKDLADELEKEKGKVKIIIKYQTVIVHDTVYIHDTIYPNADGTFTLKWDYAEYFTTDKNNYQKLNGQTKIAVDVKPEIKLHSLGTMITKNEMGLNIITGIKQNPKTDLYEIFVRSDYPGFKITKLDGAVVDPNMFKETAKKNSFGIGPSIGVGVTADFKPTIYVGIGLQWNIIKF